MPVPSIELTGSAVVGVGPVHAAAMVAQLPTRVCLGRIKPKAMPACLKLSSYVDLEKAVGVLPATINYRDKAAASIARMFLNDRLGCCVISGKGHMLGVWSANDSDSAGIVLPTDAEINSQYVGICGPGDNGCNISDVLDVMRSKGFTAGGKSYKIDGYVSVDHKNRELTKVAQLIFGATSIGIDLPQAWTNAAIWDVTNSQIVGGHDVTPIDYDDQGVYIASWGRIYLITWAAWMSTKWLTEYYASLAPLWYGNDMIAPCGLNATVLRDDLAKIGSGVIPDIAPPTPPIPVPNAPYRIRLGSDLPAGSLLITTGATVVQAVTSSPQSAGEYLLTHVDPTPPQ